MKFLPIRTALIVACLLMSSNGRSAETNSDAAADFASWNSANFGKLLARASDEEALEFARNIAMETSYLLNANPDACARILLPKVYGALRMEDFPAQYLDQHMAIQRKIAWTALKEPHTPPTEDEAGPVFDKVQDALEAKYGPDVIVNITAQGKDVSAKSTCLAWSRLYSELASRPANQGGMVTRWLFSP